MLVKNKVLVYLTWRNKLLYFTQPKFPEAGRQVIAGSMEQDETSAEAALRELKEESGIETARLVRVLGDFFYSMEKFGKKEIHHRHVVHLVVSDTLSLAESWTFFEKHPSSGGAPIQFHLQWTSLATPEPLIGGHDFFLPMLRHSILEFTEN